MSLNIKNFDWNFYVSHYRDLKHIKTEKEAINHYLSFGRQEKRQTSNIPIDFDWKFYTNYYYDLNHISNEEDAQCHYLQYGKLENRVFSKSMINITKPVNSSNKKKKLAMLLYGKAQNSYRHFSGYDLIVDYIYSYNNYKKYIFEHFENINYEIDVYFVTDKFDIEKNEKELINKYNPIKYLFVEEKTQSGSYIGKNLKIKKVTELCLSTKINYDLVLMTRFDLMFKKKFDEFHINKNKFNFISILEEGESVCDNFYVFPFSFLKDFHTITCNNLSMNFHLLRKEIFKKKKDKFINFINNEYCPVADLSFYKICRIYKNNLYYESDMFQKKLFEDKLKSENKKLIVNN